MEDIPIPDIDEDQHQNLDSQSESDAVLDAHGHLNIHFSSFDECDDDIIFVLKFAAEKGEKNGHSYEVQRIERDSLIGENVYVRFEIVMVYAKLLQQNYPKLLIFATEGDGKTVQLPSLFIIKTSTHILCPILSDEHFTLLFIDKKNKKLIFIDPYVKNEENDLGDLHEKISRYYLQGFSLKDYTRYRVEHANQIDNTSCGIIVMLFMRRIASQFPSNVNLIFPTDPRSIKFYRKVLLKDLINAAVNSEDHCQACGDNFLYECMQTVKLTCNRCDKQYHETCKIEMTPDNTCCFCVNIHLL